MGNTWEGIVLLSLTCVRLSVSNSVYQKFSEVIEKDIYN